MNARGSTEVVVATIGLSMGALSQTLFTMILVMAVVTTMAMPPMLRWSLARVPLRPDEEARLEREAFEAEGFVTNVERVLVAVDDSPTGHFASRLVGLLAGSRRIPTTILETGPKVRARQRKKAEALAKASAESAEADTADTDATPAPVDITTRPQSDDGAEEAILREIVELGDRIGVTVRTAVRRNAVAEESILRRLRAGSHNLLVMGVSPRPGEGLSFGHVAAAVLARSEHSILFVSS